MGDISPTTLSGQVALVTGGTDGLGKACALRLARLGAELILVGRNPEMGHRAVADIRANVPGSRVSYWQHDLSLMGDVQKLAEAVRAQSTSLAMLVQSAGVMLPQRTLTSEGLETVFAVQYLARFHLVRLLLPSFDVNTRIVSVSAAGTIPIRLNFNNLNGERFYNGIYGLIHESVANDLFALRFIRQNPTLRFYNYGPFYVNTGLFASMPLWFKLVIATFGRLVATTTDVAAQDMINLLTSSRPSGMYSRRLRFIKPSRYRADTAIQDRLWAISEQMVASALK